MAKSSSRRFKSYCAAADAEAKAAMAAIERFSKALDWGDRETARYLLEHYAYDCVMQYGDNAAAIAADYYDELAELAGADVPKAIIADAATFEQVAGSVGYTTRSIWDTDDDGNPVPVDPAAVGRQTASMVGRRVSSMANSTMVANCGRDGTKWARVTTSARPCAFCMMLSSRGFAYSSEQAALGYSDKYHDWCYCKAVPDFDGDGLEGYDPGDLGDQWDAASKRVSEAETRREWWSLTDAERKSYAPPDHPKWSGYGNFKTKKILAKTREMYGYR